MQMFLMKFSLVQGLIVLECIPGNYRAQISSRELVNHIHCYMTDQNAYKLRYIAGSSSAKCSTKRLSQILTRILTTVKEGHLINAS